MIVLGFEESRPAAQRLAAALDVPCREITVHRFPDGESLVRLPTDLPEKIVVYRSLDRPNDKLIELMLAVQTARESGVKHIVLIAPYLCYFRQDARFRPGEAVSQRVVGRFLAQLADEVITVDAHLHRVRRLEEVIPCRRSRNVTAMTRVAEFLRDCRFKAPPLLVGPDEESRQWVSVLARLNHYDFMTGRKRRHGDHDVEIDVGDQRVRDRHVIIIDDVVSTGHTLAQAAQRLAEIRPAAMDCFVTHALFVGDAQQTLRRAGLERLWSTDSIPHASNVVELAPLLAETVTSLAREG